MTVAVHYGRQITAVWPGFQDKVYGLAIDIGSTTIAGHLCDLASGEVIASAGLMNPQIRFGEDLMSRVSYVMMNPGGDAEMTKAVREALNILAANVAKEAGIDLREILEVTFVGNPIMHHLLLGIDPTELGGAPFALATDGAITIWASEIELRIHPNARIFVLPCIAGHVGADTAGVILSEAPHQSDEMTLIVDVGTNAEIVLGNRHKLLAASSPTGPAFEGAQISCGQRAAPGAVERVRIDPRDAGAALQGHRLATNGRTSRASPRRRWGPASPGSAAPASSRLWPRCILAGIITRDGVVDGSLAARSPRIQPEGRTFSYLLYDGRPRASRCCGSPRTTSGRSSWPRRRSMPGRGCSWTISRSTSSTASPWRGPSAAISTSNTP